MTIDFVDSDMNYFRTVIHMLACSKKELNLEKALFIGLPITKCIQVNGWEDFLMALESIRLEMFTKEIFLMASNMALANKHSTMGTSMLVNFFSILGEYINSVADGYG